MRALTSALLLFTTIAVTAERQFPKIVIETNVLALGEVSHVHLSGAVQPVTLALRAVGSLRELEIGKGAEALPIHANVVQDNNGILLLEVKAIGPFRGSLIIRDADGRKADLKFYAGNEKLLREFGKPKVK